MANSPSYVTQTKHGIYYFQIAVPRHQNSKKTLIRKSLRTRCRREALALARQWWLHMKKHNFDWEEQANLEDALYRQGKTIARRMADYGISESDEFEFRAFIEELNDNELRAYAFYDENNSQKTTTTQSPSTASPRKAPNTQSDFQDMKKAFRGVSTSDKALSEALTLYLKDRKIRVTTSTLNDMETAVERLIMFVGDIPTDQLTKSVLVEQYIDRRRQLPNNLHQKKIYFDGKSQKIDRTSGKPKLRPDGKPAMTPNYKSLDVILELAANNTDTKYNTERTIYNEFEQLRSFLKWCHSRGYVEKGLDSILTESSKRPTESTTTNFNEQDLKLIFESTSYQQGLLFDQPHLHWLPLISLYHGNRIGEISMLYVDNVFQIQVQSNGSTESIWVFDIENNKDRNQRVKNKRSMRIIPIHQTLIDLGFIEYHQQLISKREQRLFPSESVNAKGNWGGKTSIWFNNSHDGKKNGIGFAEHCGVQKHVAIKGEQKKKVFHSLRGNWITQANRLQMNQDMCRELTGHSQGIQLDVHTLSYDEGSELHTRHKEINKLYYNIDVSKIAKWRS